jgi:hypothetical protein
MESLTYKLTDEKLAKDTKLNLWTIHDGTNKMLLP